MAPQAFFIAGWLASRLGWKLADEQPPRQSDAVTTFNFLGGERGSSRTVRDGVPARGSSPTVREGSAARGSSPTVREGSEVRAIKLHLNRVEQGEHKPGRLVQVKLRCSSTSKKDPTSFVVTRSADNLHVLAEASGRKRSSWSRVAGAKPRAAQLLSREMEIL